MCVPKIDNLYFQENYHEKIFQINYVYYPVEEMSAIVHPFHGN